METANDVAIVGLGCRFPGADNADEFWRVLVNGENHVLDIPKERWNNDFFYSDDKDEPGKHYVKKAGFINKFDEWDNRLFGVSENEATRIDPQQRHVLECTHMAMEDAGLTRKQMSGSETGVYIGVMNDDYKVLASADHDDDTNYSATGMSTTIIASRVSYVFNLQGPCMVVDTACSSSMIAIHLGCQAIKTGDCEMAVCGGVSAIMSPDTFMPLCKARMMSAIGQCQTFCDTADGYARGEGCGVVILKRLDQAIRDNNKIWGVIRTGSNQDGHVSTPITAPSGEQQEELLKKVYSQYDVDPTKLQYIEAHGTGTPIGDPTEANALGHFIFTYKDKKRGYAIARKDSLYPESIVSDDSEKGALSDSSEEEVPMRHSPDTFEKLEFNKAKRDVVPIGSVKTNVGHTESAAGVAGVIKVLLMMNNGMYVPSLHVKKDKSNLNKKILLDEYGLDISLDVAEWPGDENGDRICCVNSFGFGGSNSHAIVFQTKSIGEHNAINRQGEKVSLYDVVCVSATDKPSLKITMDQLEQDIQDTTFNINDISYTSAYHRDHHPSRTLVFGAGREAVAQQLKVKSQNIDKLHSKSNARLIFVFCGVGTTWTGMCQEMMSSQSVFRDKVQEIDSFLSPLTGWCMANKFENDTDYSDPFLNHVAIFCTQVALSALWQSWGITPDVIVGQSVGEVAAAYESGAISLQDAVHVIYHRSKILAEMTGGKMMVAGNLPVAQIEEVCEKHQNKVTVAVYNSPTSCTLSGDADVMEAIKTELEEINEKENADIMIRPLSVQCAYHSHHVEPCMDVIEERLEGIQKRARYRDHISTVTGEPATGDDFQTGKYWAENIRRPVKFMQALQLAAKKGHTNVFVEIGPRQVIRVHLPNILDEKITGVCLPSMSGNKESVCMFSSLSELYEIGVDPNWSQILPSTGNHVSLPRSIFNKSKLVYIPESAQRMLRGVLNSTNTHMYVRPNGGEKAEFSIEIDKETTPFVFDHYFINSILVPGATYVEAALEVGEKKSRCSAHELSVSTEFVNPFTPGEDKQYHIDMEITEDEDDNGFRYVASKDGRPLCQGTITERTDTERPLVDLLPIRERCKDFKTKEESYDCLDRIEFNYGESLSLIENSWSSTTECLVELVVPESVKEQTKSTHLHPSIIDAMFQTFGILSTIGAEGPTLPKGLGSLVINRPPQDRMYAYSQMVKATAIGNHYNSMLISPEGHVIAEIKDFYTKTLKISEAPNQSIVYDMDWIELFRDDDETENMQTINNEKMVVFGTRRFINCMKYTQKRMNCAFYELSDNSEDNEGMFKLAIEQVPNMRSVLISPSQNIQDSKDGWPDVLKISMTAFKSVAELTQLLKDGSFSIPVFVITEDVKAIPDLHIQNSNVFGGEMWGLVRSAMGETAYNDLRLVDMVYSEENALALEYIARDGAINHAEYIIREGRLYYNEMIESPSQDTEPNQREITFDPCDHLVLKSSHPNKITNPHYQLLNKHKRATNEVVGSHVRLRLHSISIHDSKVYPTSTESEDAENTLWPEINDDGFQVVALEGIGWIEDKNKKSAKSQDKAPKTGFCYPVNVSSVVSIPSKCTFDTSTLPVYFPGLMTTSLVLWNIAEVCKQTSNVLIIVDDEASLSTSMLSNMLMKFKKMRIAVESKENFKNAVDNSSDAQTIIVQSKITQGYVEVIQKRCPRVQRIVSTDCFFPRSIQRWIQHNAIGISQTILNLDSMFTHSELTEKMPKVTSWLKSLDSALKKLMSEQNRREDEYDEDKSLFDLPYKHLFLLEDNDDGPLALKVFRTEVFRSNGCYILVGGLTGLGWELLNQMAELGAGHLATFSRRAPTEEKQHELEDIMNRFGCNIIPMQTDITDLKMLKKSMQELKQRIGDAQIKGIFHGGGVVKDMLLSNMTDEDIAAPLLPKVLGTWNLHLVSKDISLDFFVLHSSIVSVLGNPGQCNYAAGNAFQDSFAHYRRSLGLCGQSINWSTLALGMAKENKDIENNFKSQGFYYLTEDDIRSCFLRAVMTNPTQVTFGIFDWSRLELHPSVQMYPFKFARLLDKYGTKNQGFRKTDSKYHFDIEEFEKLEFDDKKNMIVELLKLMIADTFVIDSETLDEDSRFVTLGIDSMAAMSFTNSIFETVQVRVSVVSLLSDTTSVGSLALFIVGNIQNGTTGDKPATQEDSKSLLEFLNGSVTFMQKSLLRDFVKNPHSKNFMRQADFEVKGLNLKVKDWRYMLIYLLKMNPDLRRIYQVNEENGTFESVLLSADDIDVDIETVPFDSICNENVTDDRDKTFIDITKQIPLRFKIACKKNRTRMRMYIHSVVGDLSGIAMIFRDIGSYMKPYICNEPLPEKETNIVPSECVRKALTPRMLDMRQYWRLQLSQDIQPFTFGEDMDAELSENNWYQIKENVPKELVDKVMAYIQNGGMSLYNFVVSIYMVILHQKTKKDLIPIVTNVDMRGHVPQLKNVVTRCINAMPVVGDLRNMGTTKEYVKRSADRLHHMTQQSGFPYDLIEEEMQTEELKKHVGRHRLIMDNMANLNQTFKHKRVTVKLSNVFHSRHVYETTLYIVYDMKENKVCIEYGYNNACVTHEDAALVPGQIVDMMLAFIDNEEVLVSDILDGNVPIQKTVFMNEKSTEYPDKLNDRKLVINTNKKQTDPLSTKTNIDTIRLAALTEKRILGGNDNLDVIREDFFTKETSHGWEHFVHVTLARDLSINNKGELILLWGKSVGGQRRMVSLEAIQEVSIKRIHGKYNIMLRTPVKWFVLKAGTREHAVDWIQGLQAAVESSIGFNPLTSHL